MAEIVADRLALHYPLSNARAYEDKQLAPADNISVIGSRSYILALHDLSFNIQSGQRVGLVGRNGSGKSTLLKVLGGIYTPTSGSVVRSGRVSSLFNLSLGVQPDVSGRDNIYIRGLVKGWSRAEIQSRMDEVIEFSELKDVIDLPVRTYSAGMRMRLLFAIATSFSPEILLLDEWIGAGDASFQKKASERMKMLVDQAGITVIASHNRKLLRSVCDIGIWLDHGSMRAYGPIESVYREMDSHFSKKAK